MKIFTSVVYLSIGSTSIDARHHEVKQRRFPPFHTTATFLRRLHSTTITAATTTTTTTAARRRHTRRNDAPTVEGKSHGTTETLPLSFQDATERRRTKKLVLIRHGRTYMNEYLSKPGSKWGDPNFTDVFPPDDGTADRLYRDSPLSERGLAQARSLSERLSGGGWTAEERAVLEGIELVAVSPLTRALQTLEIGVLPHLRTVAARDRRDADGGTLPPPSTESGGTVPIVASPLAAERLYLVSDLGADTSALSPRYPYVDFDTAFPNGGGDGWWFTVGGDGERGGDGGAAVGGYEEWRPSGDGQTYACPGEPDGAFQRRMRALYDWIDGRDESVICVVCHWGVLEWLTGAQFENCEMRIVDFKDIKREGSSSN